MVEKARLFGDQVSVHAIMAENDPIKQKALGKKIKGLDINTWRANAQDLILPGLIAKFEQNSKCRDMLIKTEHRCIIEASPHDKFFGAGVSLQSRTLWNTAQHPGKNVMGKMLQLVRTKLNSH